MPISVAKRNFCAKTHFVRRGLFTVFFKLRCLCAAPREPVRWLRIGNRSTIADEEGLDGTHSLFYRHSMACRSRRCLGPACALAPRLVIVRFILIEQNRLRRAICPEVARLTETGLNFSGGCTSSATASPPSGLIQLQSSRPIFANDFRPLHSSRESWLPARRCLLSAHSSRGSSGRKPAVASLLTTSCQASLTR
jgi:hypothetical protein